MPYRLDLLASVRIAAGKSQDELAQASNQSLYTIVQLEQGGTVNGDQAEQIAAALSSTLELLGASWL